MSKIKFVLKVPNGETETPVMLMYNCCDGRLKYYTRQNVVPELFKSFSFSKGTKSALDRIYQAAEKVIDDFKAEDRPLTKEHLKNHLDNLFKKKKNVESDRPLIEHMDLVLIKMEGGELFTPKNKRYSKSTIKALRHASNVVHKFDPDLKRGAVNIDTYKDFIVYCQKQNFSINYIGTLLKNWKILGRLVGGNDIYQSKEFKKMSEETEAVYLSEEEIALIYNHNLPKALEVARDWFIIGCYTGLRVSDLALLSAKNYNKGYITIANEKTDRKVVIPIHSFAKSVIEKYNGFPPKISDKALNENIKTIANMARIRSSVLFTITKGGVRQDEYLQKWQMVSTHTARRSFITNLRKSGVPDSVVMKLTGIRSHVTMKRYDKLSNEEAAKIAAGHAFFKKKG